MRQAFRIRSIFTFFAALVSAVASAASYDGQHAALVDGTGTYSRSVDTQSELAQRFFDQGLRLMYGYYIPEAIASHLEALRHDPENAMIYCGLALALGPNPNSRYGGAPDDPQRNAQESITRAVELSGNASAKDRALIEAVYVRFDAGRFPDRRKRDRAYLDAMKDLLQRYPEDPDIGTLYADAYMVMEPWRYWTFEGKAKPGTVARPALWRQQWLVIRITRERTISISI
jgi:hypothetical protein